MRKIRIALPVTQFALTAALIASLGGCGGGQETGAQYAAASAVVPSSNADQSDSKKSAVAPEVEWLAKHANDYSGTDPANENYSDLNAFGNAIGDARIVALGEPSHGSGTAYDMKVRLVKYLHEKKGFDVIMVESSMFAVNRLWQLVQNGAKVDDIAPNNIFYMYSKSAQGRKLLQYIDSQRYGRHPLTLDSFETTGTGADYERDDFFPMLEAFLAQRNSTLPSQPDWAVYKEFASKVFFVWPPATAEEINFTQERLDSFYAMSTKLEGELCADQPDNLQFPDSPGIWCHIVKGMRSTGDNMFNGEYTRETVAADNFKWLYANKYAGHKVILWGHYGHLGRGTQPGYVNMGTVFDQTYGDKYYVAALTASQGADLQWWNGAGTTDTYDLMPDRDGSVEAVLSKLGKDYYFVDTAKKAPPAAYWSMPSKELDFAYDIPLLTHVRSYDGLFYFRTTQPATMNRP